MNTVAQIRDVLHTRLNRRQVNQHIRRIASQVNAHSNPDPQSKPIIFFNASTRLVGLSLNAAFSLLPAWALRLQNVPVIHFYCHAGMSRCVLGTDQNQILEPPPCRACIAQSNTLYSSSTHTAFSYQKDVHLSDLLSSLSLNRLMEFEYQLPAGVSNSASSMTLPPLPLGQLVLPSVRWALRRYHLQDDDLTRFLFREYIFSTNRIAQEFSKVLDNSNPQAAILFNGQFFPEATARWISIQRGIRTITHEVGLQPFSAFFTSGEATAYPLDVPDSFVLSQPQNKRLDDYLSQRFHGKFSMAGIQFWPAMQGLYEAFVKQAANYKQIVPVFTNVIFDTSQPHSNVVFPHMFAWLDLVLEIIHNHPETLFVLRAHPDESRLGKASQESVSQWVTQNQADSLPNLIFIDSNQSLSSYELIQRSKFVMVYNSTIGLEASIMGLPVLCAGRARYTQLPTVFFPPTPQEYRQQTEIFLAADTIAIPPEFQHNARRFLYYQLFRSSLPFDDFIQPDLLPGFVSLKDFPPQNLSPKNSSTIQVILDGILNDKPYLINNEERE